MPKRKAQGLKQNMSVVVKKDTRRLIGILAAMQGKTPSEFMSELADAAVESYFTKDEIARYLSEPAPISKMIFPKARRGPRPKDEAA